MTAQSAFKCGRFFDARAGRVLENVWIVSEDGRITYCGASEGAPPLRHTAKVFDHSASFVMPGLIDIHVHLSYGDARNEEEIDLYSSLEFRTLRGMDAAQRVLKAGYTTICDPTTSGRVSLAIRDAVDCGLFVGPKISCSGQNISTRQGLVDWYPTWIGVPDTSIGKIVKSVDEGIEAIRYQIKDGVDFIKLAMDGDSMNPASIRLSCAFNQSEVNALVSEAHRLGRKVVVHARGSEGVLYAARAGVDLIFHASWIDEEGLEAVVKNGCAICPTLNLMTNTIEFTRPTDPCANSLVEAHKRELEAAAVNLTKARKAGVKFLIGSESGFAVTPYGEWHARELINHVTYLGFSPFEVLMQATVNNAWFTRHATEVGELSVGRAGDILVLAKDPTQDVSVILDKRNIQALYQDGQAVDLTPNAPRRRHPTENSYAMWNEVYTQERVNTLRMAAE